jgi:hypothetical protein
MSEIDSELLDELRRACNARRGALHPDYALGLLKRCLEVMEPPPADAEPCRPDSSIVARAWVASRFGDAL